MIKTFHVIMMMFILISGTSCMLRKENISCGFSYSELEFFPFKFHYCISFQVFAKQKLAAGWVGKGLLMLLNRYKRYSGVI